MIIGVDLDNTIVCYDAVIHRAAVERGLVPADTPATKTAVRDRLRRDGREEEWTVLQGHVYGPGMAAATPFPGALEFLAACRRRHGAVWIVSHRTRQPCRPPAHDLHQAAREWLERQGVFRPDGAGLDPAHVCLELTAADKRARIAALGCHCFVDDLPEFLEDPAFPPGVKRILFDPGGRHRAAPGVRALSSWSEIGQLILCPDPSAS